MNMNEWLNRFVFNKPDEGAPGGMSQDEMLASLVEDDDGADDKPADDAGDKPETTDDKTAEKAADDAGDKPAEKTETDDDPNAAKGNKTGADGDGEEGFKLTVPEGAQVHGEAVKAFEGHVDAWLKDNPEATAAEALQMGLEYQAKLHEDAMGAEIEKATETAAKWVADIKADPKYGGDHFDVNAAKAVKVIDAFGDDEFKDLLNSTGLGNHPALFRFAVNASAAVSEADVIRGDAPGKSAEENVAETLYEND